MRYVIVQASSHQELVGSAHKWQLEWKPSTNSRDEFRIHVVSGTAQSVSWLADQRLLSDPSEALRRGTCAIVSQAMENKKLHQSTIDAHHHALCQLHLYPRCRPLERTTD